MRMDRVTLVLGMLVVAVTAKASAQGSTQLVGVWQRVFQRDSAGAPTTNPPAFAIYSANGYYSQTAIPTGRPKVQKPFAELTKEELVARYQRLDAHQGTYSVTGNTLTRRYVSHVSPNAEGLDQVQTFRIQGDTLFLSSTVPGSKAGAHFVRVR